MNAAEFFEQFSNPAVTALGAVSRVPSSENWSAYARATVGVMSELGQICFRKCSEEMAGQPREHVIQAAAGELAYFSQELLGVSQEWASSGDHVGAAALVDIASQILENLAEQGYQVNVGLRAFLHLALGTQMAEIGLHKVAQDKLEDAIAISEGAEQVGGLPSKLFSALVQKEVAQSQLQLGQMDGTRASISKAWELAVSSDVEAFRLIGAENRFDEYAISNARIELSLASVQVLGSLARLFWADGHGSSDQLHHQCVELATKGLASCERLQELTGETRPEHVELLRFRAMARVEVAAPGRISPPPPIDPKTLELVNADMQMALAMCESLPNRDNPEWERLRLDLLCVVRDAGIILPGANTADILKSTRLLASRQPEYRVRLFEELGNTQRVARCAGASHSNRLTLLDEQIALGRKLLVSGLPVAGDLVIALRIKGAILFDTEQYDEASDILLEATGLLRESEPLLNPLEARKTTDHNVPDLFVASLLRSGKADTSRAFEADERLRATSLVHLARLYFEAAKTDRDPEVASYAEYKLNLMRNSVGLSTDDSESAANQAVWNRNACLESRRVLKEKGLLEGLLPLQKHGDILNAAQRAESHILSLRITKRGSFAMLLNKDSGIVEATELDFSHDEFWSGVISIWTDAQKKGFEPECEEYRAPLRSLFEACERVMDPLASLASSLPQGSRLTLIPDKFSHLLPLQSMPFAGTSQLWAERFEIGFAPSVSMLRVAADWRDSGIEGITKSMLGREFAFGVFANPRGSCPGKVLSKAYLAALQAAGLKRLYGVSSDVRVGERCQSGEFHDVPYRAAHLAMHGVFDFSEPATSYLGFTDGPLYPVDLFFREFSHVDHLTLAACETTGFDVREMSGDVFNFPGLCLAFGVTSIWSALWKIDQVSSTLLWLRAHQLILGGCSKRGALAGAQRWLRDVSSEGAEDFARPFLEELLDKPGDFGLTRKEVILYVEPALDFSKDHSKPLPFADPYHWAAFQHVGL